MYSNGLLGVGVCIWWGIAVNYHFSIWTQSLNIWKDNADVPSVLRHLCENQMCLGISLFLRASREAVSLHGLCFSSLPQFPPSVPALSSCHGFPWWWSIKCKLIRNLLLWKLVVVVYPNIRKMTKTVSHTYSSFSSVAEAGGLLQGEG